MEYEFHKKNKLDDSHTRVTYEIEAFTKAGGHLGLQHSGRHRLDRLAMPQAFDSLVPR